MAIKDWIGLGPRRQLWGEQAAMHICELSSVSVCVWGLAGPLT